MHNGRRYSEKIKKEARILRKKGWTHREIKERLGIGLGTAFIWTKGITLTLEQKRAIQERRYKPTFTKERREKLRELARKHLSLYWNPTPTTEQLLQRITDFFRKHGRIPFKREFNNTYEEYRKRFGSWNNAIQLAGFEPNPVIFSKKFIANDGHTCDSYAEKIIDDWLFKYQIVHGRNFPYQKTKMTADFAIGNTRIEYFGLAGEDKLYDQIIQRKREICQKKELTLIEIYPTDLFPNRLSKILNLKKLK